MPNLFTAATLFYSLLSQRVDRFIAAPELANESRANLAVKSLEFYRFERKFTKSGRPAEPDAPDPARKYVVKRFDEACDYIDATKDEKERFYLRALLVEEAVKTSSLRGEFYLESAIESTLDQIEDGDERQKALYAYAGFYARRLAFHPDENEMGRVKLNGWIDEIDDLNEYEDLIAEATASAFFGLIPDFSDPLSIVKSMESVGILKEKVSNFETYEASFKLDDERSTQLVEEMNVPLFAELLRNMAFQTVKNLYELSASIENRKPRGVKDDEEYEKLDDDDVMELKSVARNVVLHSPFVLEHFKNLSVVLVLHGALNAFEPILQRVQEALETLEGGEDDPAYLFKKECYRRDKAFYEKERDDYVMTSCFLVHRAKDGDPLELVRRIALQARLTFVYDDGDPDAVELAKLAVRDSLSIIPKIENVCDRIACWRMLAEAHFDGQQSRPLQKFAQFIRNEIDSIDSELTRDNEKSKAFPVLARIYDAERLLEFAESFESDALRAEYVAKAKIYKALQEVKEDRNGAKYSAALADCACDLLEDVEKQDSLIATEVFLQVSRFLDEELDYLLGVKKIRVPRFC